MVPPFLTYAILSAVLQAPNCDAENVLARSTFFKRVDEDATYQSEDATVSDATVNQITEAFFKCGGEGECNDVIKSTTTATSKAVSNKTELNEIKESSEVWEKVKPVGKDCDELNALGVHKSDVYKIWPPGFTTSMKVYCAMSPEQGAIVIQRRAFSDTLDFNRTWSEYKTGFGSLTSSMWIGLDNLHLLAGPGRGALLNVELIHRNDTNTRIRTIYKKFEVASEAENYKITASECTGHACDALAYQNGAEFSTMDNDNDGSLGIDCAKEYTGGWWFKNCTEPNLTNVNGLLPDGNHTESKKTIRWSSLGDDQNNILYTVMKIRIGKS